LKLRKTNTRLDVIGKSGVCVWGGGIVTVYESGTINISNVSVTLVVKVHQYRG